MQELYGEKVTPDMVTAITDKVIPEIREWQKRQLEEQYAIVFVDATYFNVKQDGIVTKKATLHKLFDILRKRKQPILYGLFLFFICFLFRLLVLY